MTNQNIILLSEEIFNQSLLDEIESILSMISTCAFYLSGNDEMDLTDNLDNLGLTIEEFDPEDTYQKYYDSLVDSVGGYNYLIEHDAPAYSFIEIVVDNEKTDLLNNRNYKIYKIQKIKK